MDRVRSRSPAPIVSTGTDGASLVALRLRDDIVDAVTFKPFYRLRTLVQRAFKLQVTKADLVETGLGHFLADSGLWNLVGDSQTVSIAALTVTKWRNIASSLVRTLAIDAANIGVKVSKPLGGRLAQVQTLPSMKQNFRFRPLPPPPGPCTQISQSL